MADNFLSQVRLEPRPEVRFPFVKRLGLCHTRSQTYRAFRIVTGIAPDLYQYREKDPGFRGYVDLGEVTFLTPEALEAFEDAKQELRRNLSTSIASCLSPIRVHLPIRISGRRPQE